VSNAERLFNAGFHDLIPVIPPGAPLAPTSKISVASLGKTPGRRLDNGLWVGLNWRALQATAEDVKLWGQWGANVGLKAARFPGVDIDCADEGLAVMIEQAAFAQLGQAPVRIGNPPKRLLPYRLAGEPFTRMRLVLKRGDKQYLVEILAAGQQYLVAGVHPTTMLPYSWSWDPADIGVEEGLGAITRAQAAQFLDYLAETLGMLGYDCTRIGDGSPETRTARSNQGNLEAPSIEELRAAMELIPNDDLFPGYPEFIKMLHAVRAAAGAEEEDGYEIMAAWAQKRNNGEGPSVKGESVRSLWRRTTGPFSVGWSWIAELARPHGFNDAPFGTEGEAPSTSPTFAEANDAAVYLSDQWLALRVVEAASGVLRYVPAQGRWLVWEGGRWRPDTGLLAEDTVKRELRKIAAKIACMGATNKEKEAFIGAAKGICSGAKAAAVRVLVQSDRRIAVAVEALDHDKWTLNTPAGMVDLKTGAVMPAHPNALCTKSTSVAPDSTATPALWLRFLHEATGGDVELVAYLQRLAGYCLTGSTEEQVFAFLYGPGGNGKGVFLKTLLRILADYGYSAPMTTFVASSMEKHPTEMAAMCGARMVTASETQAGRRWDEARVKGLVGGDPVTAHFMRQDDFTYYPTFKLLFAGNHKPEVRDLDAAMRRRIHLVPFVVTPKVINKRLEDELESEWPAILAWMVQGCLAWQNGGLAAPASVLAATATYFEEADPVGQWLNENTDPAPGEWIEITALYDSWKEWANRREEYVGKVARLGQILVAQKYPKRKHPTNRRSEIGGLKIVKREDPLKGMTA
jgi:putative DNA primase/helicase